MPIVGQFASLARAGSFLLPGGAFESIATVTVGSGGASSIEFTSIGSGWQHLQIRMILRFASAGAYQNGMLQFNGDTTTAYTLHAINGNGSAASADGYGTGTFNGAYMAHFASGGSSANIFGAAIVDILDYADTSKRRVVRTLGGYDSNGAGWLMMRSSMWNSTAALTSIKILDPTLNNLAQYSTAALYGIKAP